MGFTLWQEFEDDLNKYSMSFDKFLSLMKEWNSFTEEERQEIYKYCSVNGSEYKEWHKKEVRLL